MSLRKIISTVRNKRYFEIFVEPRSLSTSSLRSIIGESERFVENGKWRVEHVWNR